VLEETEERQDIIERVAALDIGKTPPGTDPSRTFLIVF
jgi:hypothetical protein